MKPLMSLGEGRQATAKRPLMSVGVFGWRPLKGVPSAKRPPCNGRRISPSDRQARLSKRWTREAAAPLMARGGSPAVLEANRGDFL